MSKLAGMTKGIAATRIAAIKDLDGDRIAKAVGGAAENVAAQVQRDCTKIMKCHEPQGVKLIGLALLYLVGAVAMGVVGLCWLAPRIRSTVAAHHAAAASVARRFGRLVPAALFALLTIATLTNRVPLSLFGFVILGAATLISACPAPATFTARVPVA